MPDEDQQSLGGQILAAIRRAVERTAQMSRQLRVPGEGNERPFRYWLTSFLLVPVLHWPEDKVKTGEGFDIILLDEQDKERVTIETKAPLHKASGKEREDFTTRLRGLPRLRAAYFTNGTEWDRLDLQAPAGIPEIAHAQRLDISEATSEEVEAFFAPLRGDRQFQHGRRNRSLVSRSQPHILEQLANDLDLTVRDFAGVLEIVYHSYNHGHAGSTIKATTQAIFDDWCRRSLQAPVGQVVAAIQQVLQDPQSSRSGITSTLRNQGFTPAVAEATADRLLALPPERRSSAESLRSALESAFQPAVSKLCAQSAHLLLARCLVYRVGEDAQVFPPLLGGPTMDAALALGDGIAVEPTPALALFDTARRRMSDMLPVVYQLSDLDWWLVHEDKLAVLSSRQLAAVKDSERDIDLASARMLRTLDGFEFSKVDADVWRNLYQHYLPGEERQRIGGFYTPEILVEFILDLAGYVPEAEGLCTKTLLDPACGSGAFVSAAASRLLRHLELHIACHSRDADTRRGVPEWQRQKMVLDAVLANIHAIDIHPFAAFLTTLNLTFLLLPLYASARKHNPGLSLGLQVFSTDSLEKPDEGTYAPGMWEQLNSRIQMAEESHQQYRALLTHKFDFVVGNPPWGGVLKGPLAPVYDKTKKRRFNNEYPSAAHGKYDIYGLFMERSLQLLGDGGRLAIVTQDTFLDKEWAAKLRKLLATHTEIQFIIDLNPFGQLFFHAMNTPAVTVLDNTPPRDGFLIGVTTTTPKFYQTDRDRRRAIVLETVGRSISELANKTNTAVAEFSTAGKLSRRMMRDTAEKGWVLRPAIEALSPQQVRLHISDILESRQGVTPGGCLEVFQMPDQVAIGFDLEAELVHRAVKSRDMERWSPIWHGLVLLYPYILANGKVSPAFAISDAKLKDALDFEIAYDDREREIRRGRVLDNATAKDILEHRIALGLVKFPHVARYLVGRYSRLEGRVFEQQGLRHWGKQWYEYHRPRDPRLLLTTNRILSPTLTRGVRFSLDSEGFLADHACLFLLPTAKTASGREGLRQALARSMERLPTQSELLQYCLAFLNSRMAQEELTRHRPTPKGSYQITEQYLSEVFVAPPRHREDAERIIQIVALLTHAVPSGDRVQLERQLDETVTRLIE